MILEDLFSALVETGLISAVTEVPFLTDEPKIPACMAGLSGRAIERYGDHRRSGYGYSRNRLLAAVKAEAECLERLCLSHIPIDDLVQGTHAEIDGAVSPALFLNQAPGQNLSEATAEARSYSWWPAHDRTLDRQCMIPAQMVFLRAFQGETPLRLQHLSTGGALGETGSGRAFQSGLFEVIERDASISAYLSRRPLRRITGLPDEVEQLAGYLRRYALEPYLLDAATGLGAPTVLAVTIDRSGLGPAVNIGCRTAETYQDAMQGAMLESIQARRSLRLSPAPPDIPPPEEIATFHDRVGFWSPVERIRDLDFWLKAPAEVNWEQLKERTVSADDVVQQLAGRGYHVFVADVTLPEVRDQGFEVVRVVVPELHALYLDEGCKVLYSPHHGVIDDDPSLPPHPIA